MLWWEGYSESGAFAPAGGEAAQPVSAGGPLQGSADLLL